jgi:hypothetical protein
MAYPAFQCFKTKSRDVYSSSYQVKNHDEGAAWVQQAMEHFGIKGSDLLGKPYTSNIIPTTATIYP